MHMTPHDFLHGFLFIVFVLIVIAAICYLIEMACGDWMPPVPPNGKPFPFRIARVLEFIIAIAGIVVLVERFLPGFD